MNLLILAALAPLGGFYLYALASFQKELRGARQRETRPGAKTIPLYFRDGKLTALDAETDSTIESRLSRTATEPQLSETASVTPVHREAPNLERSIQGPYRFESAYFGPFFLIPIRKPTKAAASQRETEFAAGRAG